MNPQVVIFGASGFLGRYLSRHYRQMGWEVVCVARKKEGWSGDGMFLEWDGTSGGPWELALEGADRVIQMVGPDWRKGEVGDVVAATEAIGRGIERCRVAPRVWMLGSSALGYRDVGVAVGDWSGDYEEGWSGVLAAEEKFFGFKVGGGTRKVVMRMGWVLAREEGTVLERLRRWVRCGLGGRMGDGRQRVAWVHMEDFLSMVDVLAADSFADGVFHLVAPEAVTNEQLMRELREQQGMPVGLRWAPWLMELAARRYGWKSEVALRSQWVEPMRLAAAGFRWRWPMLGQALADLEGRKGLEGFFRQPERRAVGVRVWTPGSKLASGVVR